VSHVIRRDEAFVFITVDDIIVSTQEIHDVDVVRLEGEPSVYAYKVTCVPTGCASHQVRTYWVDAVTYDRIAIVHLNRQANAHE
jgi:hypothetical protein